jgi:glycosyltransferase involved in cell wall biosynthesis
MKNVLFVGCDKGAWQMRGRQLADALGARYTSKPTERDWQSPSLIVLVKRAAYRWATEASTCRAPLVWDVLDVWQQPAHNQRRPIEVALEIQAHARVIGVRRLVGATRAMATSIGGTYLSHHCRLGLQPTPPRRRPAVVAYDGSPRYLGSWAPAIERACARLGLRFVVNPSYLGDVDALVAVRGEEWDGEICRLWKSGVKYVNAIAAGRPILAQYGAALAEIAPAGAIAIISKVELPDAIEGLVSLERRERAFELGRSRASAFTVEAIASEYRHLLAAATRRAA